jgi:hypothetical protein
MGLRTLMRNYIETVPRSAYDQSVTHFRTRTSDVLIVSDPGRKGLERLSCEKCGRAGQYRRQNPIARIQPASFTF